jgi:hypothetical protein
MHSIKINTKLAEVLQILLIITLGFNILYLLQNALFYQIIHTSSNHTDEPTSPIIYLIGSIKFVHLMRLVHIGLFLLASILFITWFYRVYLNLHQIFNNLKYKPFWAIIGFIIPIVSLFIPIAICKETIKLYGKIDVENELTGKTLLSMKWANFWWLFYILYFVCLRLYGYIDQSFKTSVSLDWYKDWALLGLFSALFSIAAIFCLLKIIKRIALIETKLPKYFNDQDLASHLVDI